MVRRRTREKYKWVLVGVSTDIYYEITPTRNYTTTGRFERVGYNFEDFISKYW